MIGAAPNGRGGGISRDNADIIRGDDRRTLTGLGLRGNGGGGGTSVDKVTCVVGAAPNSV